MSTDSIDFEQERQRFFMVNRQRRLLLPKAMIVGLLAGGVAVAFHLCLDLGEDFRNRLIEQAHQRGGQGMAVVAGFSTISLIVAAFLVKRFAPEAGGSGIPHVKAVLQGYRTFRWLRVLIVKFVSGLIGISGGLALGREGPTVQMGAAVGEGLVSLPWIRQTERRALVAAGSGAGLSAAFNSPLAGVVFVLEELQGKFASLEFFAATLACLAADMVCRALLGQFPVFHVAVLKAPDLALLLAFIPLGMLAGFFGVVFNQTLLAAQTLSAIRLKFRVLWWLACGLALGLVGWLEPGLLGGGQRFLDGLLVNGIAASSVALFFGIRFLLTIASYSTGSAGGIFSPILVLGALLGSLVENIVHLLFPQLLLEPNAFAVVGMAAYFTGVVRAPLTGIVLMIEMTGNYGLILPLFVACFSSLLIADELNDLPIYEALLERDLRNQ
jgi:CIC family chloride channel protein